MWDSGYVTETEYTYGVYPDLAPERLRLALLLKGVRFPVGPGEPLRYLELGCGHGVSVNMHAAANPGEFWANDFNPVHASYASQLARASGADLRILDDSFEELANRDDLPQFDVIALHGVWSWVSEHNRQTIARIFRRNLKPGGVVYVSYNTLHGWPQLMPIRDLMVEYAKRETRGSLDDKIGSSIGFIDRVMESGTDIFKSRNPENLRLKNLRNKSGNYVAHELFNKDWTLMSLPMVAETLADCKLSYATSCFIGDKFRDQNLTPESRRILNAIGDPIFRDAVYDFMISRGFREDIFVKGLSGYGETELKDQLSKTHFVLVGDPEKRPKAVRGLYRNISLDTDIAHRIMDILQADDFRPKTIREIHECAGDDSHGFHDVLKYVCILCKENYVSQAHGSEVSSAVRDRCLALNREICGRSLTSRDVKSLASPVTGSGLPLFHFEMLFVDGLLKQQGDVPGALWEAFRARGLKLMRDGKRIQDPDENLAELRQRYDVFVNGRARFLKSLGVI